ncbi:MAG: septal ring lytic transglycosylase RlpA family protein [Gammaproteobacteria bacterium]
MIQARLIHLGWLILLGCTGLSTPGCSIVQRAEPPPVESRGRVAPPPDTPSSTSEPLSRYGNPEFYVVFGERYVPLKSAAGFRERGIASLYGPDFHGGLTSSRETYDMYQLSAAHKVLPLPTWVEVTNLENGRKAVVRVNDRGPFKDNRVIDLSYAAALKLDVVKTGTAFVEIRTIESAPMAKTTPAQSAVVTGLPARMYLQIGAFGDRANAERLKARVEPEFNGDVRIFAESETAPGLYKVQLGPIRDVAHADQAVSALEQLGIAEHHFVSQ